MQERFRLCSAWSVRILVCLGGLAFLFAAPAVFAWFEITPPNHFGYVHFPAALLIVFAVLFIAVAVNPIRNRNLIPYGVLLKAAYCGTVFFHWIGSGIPDPWKPFAACDLVFAVLFLWAFAALGPRR